MKNLFILLFLTFSLFINAQTQSKMNKDVNDEYQKSEIELNSIYKKILTEYKSDSIFIDRLKKTQKIWISYRDAELEIKFPAENKQAEYGSVYPMCVTYFLKELTDERIKKLKTWLTGIEEGDVCSGSVKTK